MNWLFAFFVIINHTIAHSWIECTDYDPISFKFEDLGQFDRSRCHGYGRAFQMQFDQGFGVNTGYDNEAMTCRNTYKPTDYTPQIMMATYTPGQTIYISHPAKNHAADTCTNSFISSGVFVVKMSSQVGVDTYDVSLPMVGGDHVNGNIDHLGFQRCYHFCDNQDFAHCLTGWVLPKMITPGRHSFLWQWELNPGQFYTNCFDAMIEGDAVNSSHSSSNMSDDDIHFHNDVPSFMPMPTTMVPMPTTMTPMPTTITPMPTTMTPMPTPQATTPTPDVPTPTIITTQSPEIITSGSTTLEGPFSKIKSILVQFNMSHLFNITLV